MKEKLEIETPQAKAIEVLRFKLMKTEQTCLVVPVALPKMTNSLMCLMSLSLNQKIHSPASSHILTLAHQRKFKYSRTKLLIGY